MVRGVMGEGVVCVMMYVVGYVCCSAEQAVYGQILSKIGCRKTNPPRYADILR